jgi:hypothetical protein
MAEMFMEKMHAFGNLLQDEWQVFTTPETHLPKIPLERMRLCHTISLVVGTTIDEYSHDLSLFSRSTGYMQSQIIFLTNKFTKPSLLSV